MSLFDSIRSIGQHAYDAAHQAAGAIGQAAQNAINYAQANMPGAAPQDNQNPGRSSVGSVDEPARSRSSHIPPHLQNAHEVDLDADSDADEEDAIGEGAAHQGQQQNPSNGWSPYKILPKTASLGTHFEYLKNDALYTAKQKMEKELAKLKEINDEVDLLGDLLDRINTLSEQQEEVEKGGFDCARDPELQQLLTNARNKGLEIAPEKTKFTKREKDLLIKQIERKTRDAERKVKEQVTKVEESKTMLNEFVSILKACADKIFEAIKKILGNIK